MGSIIEPEGEESNRFSRCSGLAEAGWGAGQDVFRIAKECGVKQLFLFHHDPDNDDACVDDLVETARRAFPNTIGAAEGLELDLPIGEVKPAFREVSS